MKKLLLVLVIALCSISSGYSQGFLGKKRWEVKKELRKDFSPRTFSESVRVTEISDSNGTFERFWWSIPGDNSISFRAFFNEDGVCIVEEIIINNRRLAEVVLNNHSKNSKYFLYENKHPKVEDTRKFVEDKTSIEVTSVVGLNIYCFWVFNNENASDVSRFFKTFYNREE